MFSEGRVQTLNLLNMNRRSSGSNSLSCLSKVDEAQAAIRHKENVARMGIAIEGTMCEYLRGTHRTNGGHITYLIAMNFHHSCQEVSSIRG